jgi:hypothetical protein
VVLGREDGHVGTDFRQYRDGHDPVEARNCLQQLDFFRPGFDVLVDERIDFLERLVEAIEQAQRDGEHPAVHSVESALERHFERFNLLLHRALRERSHFLRGLLARRERSKHEHSGDAKDIRRHAIELDVRGLQHFQNALLLSRAVLHQPLAVTRQITQLTQHRRRHEARSNQSVLHQLSEPFRILHVRLSTRDVLDVVRIANNEEPRNCTSFEHGVEGAPKDAGALHRDCFDVPRQQPLSEFTQSGSVCRKSSRLSLRLLAAFVCDARDHRLLVHVDSTNHSVHHVHAVLR